MVQFLLLLVLYPHLSYVSILNKIRLILLKQTKGFLSAAKVLTAAGLCKARKRFSANILKWIWQKQLVPFYTKKNMKLWRGFRVCVADGTSFTLNKAKKTLKHFPAHGEGNSPKMIASVLYDVLNRIPIDIEWSRLPTDERGLLWSMMKRSKEKLLFVLDRGYPAGWLMYLCIRNNCNFLMRLQSSHNPKLIKKLGHNDWLASIEIKTERNRNRLLKILSVKKFRQLNSIITIRLIKTHRKGFKPRWIASSLIDENVYAYDEISSLYNCRWKIENYYRDLKHIFKINTFRSKSLNGTYQEIYASMILSVILQDYINKAVIKYNVPVEEISFKRTFYLLTDYILLLELLIDDINKFENFIFLIISLNRQKVRPGRSFKRVFYRKIKSKTGYPRF
jgi:hypothetical protein